MPRSAKKFLTALQIFLALNLLSKQYKYDAFIFELEGAYLSYVTFRAKMYKEVVGLFSQQINLVLECGSRCASQKKPLWDSSKTYSHCCHFLVSGSRYDLISANICC